MLKSKMAISQVGKQETVAGSHGVVLGEPASDLAALHQGVDIALSPSFLKAVQGRTWRAVAVLGSKLRHKIIVVFERGQILLEEFAPLRADFLKDDLLGLGGGYYHPSYWLYIS
jgi:hypothetical protein